MTIFKRGFFVFFAALVVLAACRKDEEPVDQLFTKKISLGNIEGVNGPTSGSVNEELLFDITWNSADSTQRFDHLSDSAILNTRIIKLFAKTLPADSLKADTGATAIRYKFTAPTAGTYFLKFYKDSLGKAAIIDTVTIK